MRKFWYAAVVAIAAWGLTMHTLATAAELGGQEHVDAVSATVAATYDLGATNPDSL